MAARAIPSHSKRTSNRAHESHQAPFTDDYERVPADYKRSGGWEAFPRAVKYLYGDKMPSGFAWMILTHFNRLQLQNWRNGNTYSDIPGEAWSDGRPHRLATDFLSVESIKTDVGCSTRTVEATIAGMVKQGILAKRKDGKLMQYALVVEAWPEVSAPQPETPDEDDEDEDNDDLPPAAKEGEPFRMSGSAAVNLPKVRSFGLADNVAKQFELTSIIVGGEMRITDVRVISESDETPDDRSILRASACNPLIPLGEKKTSSENEPASPPSFPAVEAAPADYASTASAPTASKAWADALNDFTLSLRPPEAAGFALVQRVSAVCTPLGITPLDFLSYCDQQRATALGNRALVKCGAGILRQWAEHFAVARELQQRRTPMTRGVASPSWWPTCIPEAIALVDNPNTPADQVTAVLASEWGPVIAAFREPDPPKGKKR